MRIITVILVIILVLFVLYTISNWNYIKLQHKTAGGSIDKAYGYVNKTYNNNLNKLYGGLALNEWIIGYTLLPDDFVPDVQPNTHQSLMIEYSENWNRAHLIKTFLSAAQCYQNEYPKLKIGYSILLNRFTILNSDVIHTTHEKNDLRFCLLKDEQSYAAVQYLNYESYFGQRICIIDDRRTNDRNVGIDINFNNNRPATDPLIEDLFKQKGITNRNNEAVYVGFYNVLYSPEEMIDGIDTSLKEKRINTNTINLNDRNVYKFHDYRENITRTTKNKFLAINYTNATNLVQALTGNNKTRDNWTETRRLIKGAMDKYSFVFVFFSNDFTQVYIIGWNTLMEMNTVFNYLLSQVYVNAANKMLPLIQPLIQLRNNVIQLNVIIMNTNQQFNLQLTNPDSPIEFINRMNMIDPTQLNQANLMYLNNVKQNVTNQWNQILADFNQICLSYSIQLNQNITTNLIENILNDIINNIFISNFNTENLKANADNLKTNANNILLDYLGQYHQNVVTVADLKLKGVIDYYDQQKGKILRDYPILTSTTITTSNHPNPDSLFKFRKYNILDLKQFTFSVENLTGLNGLGPFNRGLLENHYVRINVRFFDTLKWQITHNNGVAQNIKNYCNNSQMPPQPAGPINVNNRYISQQPHITNIVLN